MATNAQTFINGLGNALSGLIRTRRTASATPAPTPAPTTTSGLTPQEQAFQTYRDSTGYQFRLGQGQDAINARSSVNGTYHSGAAEKALLEYGQNFASNEFGNYMNYLGGQQNAGLTATLAQTGLGSAYGSNIAGLNTGYAGNMANLGTGYANALAGINSNLANAQSGYASNVGNIYGNQAMAQANNTNSMIGGITGALGSFAGSMAYRPYAVGTPTNLLAGTPYA